MTRSINIEHCAAPTHILTPRISIFAMFAVWKERRELARMSENRLRDLGISQKEAEAESARPFWDLPKCPR